MNYDEKLTITDIHSYNIGESGVCRAYQPSRDDLSFSRYLEAEREEHMRLNPEKYDSAGNKITRW